MDANGVTCTGVSRENLDALAAPITYLRGLKVSEYLREKRKDSAIITVKSGFRSADEYAMHLESIPGDGDCAWTSIVTALVLEKCSDLDDADYKLMHDRVAKLKSQTFDLTMDLIAGRKLYEPDQRCLPKVKSKFL